MTTLILLALLAQIGYPGGQYPGGQYPGGQYPGGGGGGIPFPGRGKKTTSSKQDNSVLTRFFKGTIRQLDEKTFQVEADDSRIIDVKLTDKTKKPKELAVGDFVQVSAHEDGTGGFLADVVEKLDQPGKPATASSSRNSTTQPAPESNTEPPSTVVLKGPKYDDGDSGPPKLQRGIPPPSKKAAHVQDKQVEDKQAHDTHDKLASNTAEKDIVVPGSTPEPPVNPRQAFIERAKSEAEGFLTGLPNYVCQENTTRYVSEGKSGWHALDVVSLDLVYQDGKEDYRNVAINGKPWKKPVEESGAWSTGEFGTVLRDLFSPATNAKFKYVKDSTASGLPAHMYDFVVERPNSHWRVTVVAQSIFPAYKGSIWLDKKDARPLRIEMQATNIPAEFPEDAVESAVDYGFVSLGSQKFFVPLKAEVLSCRRGENSCDKNVIEFRNYHKYTGQSDIIFK